MKVHMRGPYKLEVFSSGTVVSMCGVIVVGDYGLVEDAAQVTCSKCLEHMASKVEQYLNKELVEVDGKYFNTVEEAMESLPPVVNTPVTINIPPGVHRAPSKMPEVGPGGHLTISGDEGGWPVRADYVSEADYLEALAAWMKAGGTMKTTLRWGK